jgi:import receptor subunit TOM20
VVAVLDHDLQETGTHCTFCLRSVDLGNAVIPPVDRFSSVYCSTDCETRSKHQSQNLLFGRESVLPPALLPLAGIPGAAESRNAAQTAFADYLKSKGKSLPLLVARFAARQGESRLVRLTIVS